jgi:phosphohistidine phosphatase SixA
MRDQGLDGSQLRDPGLSKEGEVVVELYGPILRKRLEAEGINLDTAIYASSPLRRAKQTLAALFPGKRGVRLPLFGEHGNIPENTPAGQTYQKPNLAKTLRQIKSDRDIIIVGHGSFLTSTVWPSFAKKEHEKFKNLDAFIVEGPKIKDLPFRMARRNRKTRSRRSRNRKTRRNQRGGFPLAMYQSGAQFEGTSPTMTGRDLVSSTDVMVRSGLGRF